MTIKEKIKSYNFWVSLASAIILILKVLGNKFGFDVDETFASDLITCLCSILVILGIIVTPTTSKNSQTKTTESITNNATNIANLLNNETINYEAITENNNLNQTTEVDETINNEENTLEENCNSEINMCEATTKEDTVEPVTNENFAETETHETESVSTDKSSELYEIFKIQKEKFKDDISNYINLLETEITSIKNDLN